ncbi:GNAT family N-acetyltransferase [Salinispira pacifica]|nr:GNAT family N-acetyltransferase [Salinispira pacifica]
MACTPYNISMITYITAALSHLDPIPLELSEMVKIQLEEDGMELSTTEAENRLRQASQSGLGVYICAALETDVRDETSPSGLDERPLFNRLNDGALRGFGFFNLCYGLECGGEYLWLNELHVDRESRRKGIATGILKHIEQWARKRGCAYSACLTGSDNEAAQNMYRSQGFSISKVNWVEKDLTAAPRAEPEPEDHE